MVLFFFTFSVLEEQSMRNTVESKTPNFKLGEVEKFAETGYQYPKQSITSTHLMMYHISTMNEDGSWIAGQNRVFESETTGCVRIQASFAFASEAWCPLFMAFGELFLCPHNMRSTVVPVR